MRKGFTLIELLAVIVILAIIALIATPIILNIINDSKEEADVRSAENYLDAVEYSVANNLMKNSNENLDGSYTISSNGEKLTRADGKELKVNFDGEGIDQGTLVIKNGKVSKLLNSKIGNDDVKIVNGKIEKFKGSTLLTGSDFNSAISTLAGSNTNIKSITFLADGKLPQGYTLETLTQLTSDDVSLNQDNSIMAYYDGNGGIYVYSKNKILANENSSRMFASLSVLNLLNASDLDTTNTIDMIAMFEAAYKLENIDLSNWDTSSVTNMSGMFGGNLALTTLDLSNWDTSSLNSVESMFVSCVSLISVDLSGWDTTNVTDMSSMFASCTSLTTLNLNSWNVAQVSNFSSMFGGCSKLTTLFINNWNTTSATNMSSMFGSTNLTILNINGFDISNVTNISGMFHGTSNLTCVKVGSKWDKTKETTAMFQGSKISSTTTSDCPVTNS